MTAGPSGSSGSPRTSISTSSSRIGWQSNSTATRSDSRSSVEDDSPTFPHSHIPGRGWYPKHTSTQPSLEISIPGIPTQPILPGRVARAGQLPQRTRHWSWLFEDARARLGLVSRLNFVGARSSAVRNRERDRLLAGYGTRRRDPRVLGSKGLGRAMAFVPTTFFSAVSLASNG
jgi:hypothetical protein